MPEHARTGGSINSQRNDPPIIEIEQAQAANLPALRALLAYCGPPNAGVDAGSTGRPAPGGQRTSGMRQHRRSVAVAPLLRGRRQGEQLVSLPSRLSDECDIDAVYLLTETAKGFFPRFGFTAIERSEVPPALHKFAEWTTVCASTAQAMARRLPAAP